MLIIKGMVNHRERDKHLNFKVIQTNMLSKIQSIPMARILSFKWMDSPFSILHFKTMFTSGKNQLDFSAGGHVNSPTGPGQALSVAQSTGPIKNMVGLRLAGTIPTMWWFRLQLKTFFLNYFHYNTKPKYKAKAAAAKWWAAWLSSLLIHLILASNYLDTYIL